MTAKIRVGILSFAHYHANYWAEAVARSPDAVLAGVWDADRTRGSEAAARFGTIFQPDLDVLLAGCDAVGVTSETVHHAALIEAAAEKGVHVLCEKPMATTLADCDRIERAIHAAGVVYMQSFPKRFDPINRELVELVWRGDLGRLSLVRVRHAHFHGLDPAFGERWLADPVLGGGGTLLDEGVHAADFLRWLLGDPVAVQATISNRTLGLPVEDTAVAIFTFPAGVMAEVATSWSMIAADTSVEVYGTGGTALLGGVDLASRDFSRAPYLRVFQSHSERGRWRESGTTPSFAVGDFHQEVARQFIACLTSGREPAVGLRAGRAALAMILAAYRSAERGTVEAIDPVRP